jgi:hypothetical protein
MEVRKRSGFFFVRVKCGCEIMESDRIVVAHAGKVVREGSGTATDEQDAWYVVRSTLASASAFRATLQVANSDLESRVERVELVKHPNEGSTLSKQTSLIAVA